jgi:hypothetical protein
MRIKLIAFVITAFVVLQPTTTFGAQQPEEQSYWQRFSNWMRGKATDIYESTPRAREIAASSAGIALWSGTRADQAILLPASGYITYQGIKQTWNAIKNGSISSSLAGGALLSVGLTLGGLPVVNTMSTFSDVNGSTAQSYALLAFGAIGITAMSAGLISAVYQNVIVPLQNGEVEKDQTVDDALDNMTYEMIKAVISDQEAYPTYSTKIHALLKKNEFLNGDDSDVVVEKACNKLIAELKDTYIKDSDDDAIDQALGNLRQTLAKKNEQEQITSLMIKETETFSPEQKAIVSLLRRLQNKLAIDLKRQAQNKK